MPEQLSQRRPSRSVVDESGERLTLGKIFLHTPVLATVGRNWQ